jgi:hypothetical protein
METREEEVLYMKCRGAMEFLGLIGDSKILFSVAVPKLA